MADSSTGSASTLPDEKTVTELRELVVKDKAGKAVPFDTLIQGPRVVTVLIRHFDCGNCMQYVRALAQDLPPEKLAAMEPSTKLVILGCGESERIPQYHKFTSCPYDIYADPGRAVYDKLKCVSSFGGNMGSGKPKYMTSSLLGGLKESILSTIAGGITGGGKKNQNGGELIWVGGELKFIHRMQGTTDHLEVAALEETIQKFGGP